MSASKTLTAAAGLALIALAVAAGVNPLSNNDIWLHITTGDRILETGAIPSVDEYTFTHAGSPYVPHEWLAQIILALVFRWAGVGGLIALKPLAMILAAGTVAAVCLRLGGSPLAAFLAAVITLIATTSHLYTRPHLFTFVMVPVAMLLLLEVRKGSRRALVGLLMLQVLWCNLHGGFVVGILMALAMGAWTAAATMVVGSLANPSGVHLYSFVTGFADPALREVVREWGGPLSRPFFGSFHFYFYVLLLGGTAVTALHLARRRRAGGVAILVLFAGLSFMSKRHVSLLGVAASPWMGLALTERSGPSSKEGARRQLQVAVAMVLLIAAAASVYGVPHEAGQPRHMGVGVGSQVPVEALDFVTSEGLRGNALVSYALGAYVIHRTFPDSRVSIDSRTDVHGSRFVAEYARAMSDPSLARAFLKRYPVDWAVLSFRHEAVEGPVLALGADPGWALVYFDDLAMVYVARHPGWADLIERKEYLHANPYLFLSGRRNPDAPPAAVLAESTRAVREAPRSIVALMMRGTALQAIGNHAEAIITLEKAHGMMSRGDSGEAVLAGLLGTSYVAMGEEEKAVEAFTRLLDLSPGSEYAREMLQEIRSRSTAPSESRRDR